MAIGALLLCAGLGTRLRPYTHILPKPAIPFWGLPLCYYSLYFLKQIDCFDVVMNLHHLPEKLIHLSKDKDLSDFRFKFSLEDYQPMGSGGALFFAQNHLKKFSSFFAINSDEVMIPPSSQILADLAQHFEKTKALATLLVTDHPDLQKTLKPVWINTEGVVRGFGEKPKLKEKLRPVHYTGYKIFSKDVLSLLPEGESHIFHDTLVPAMSRGALVNTLFVDCHWWETGSLQGLLTATAACTKIVHKSPQKNHFQHVYNSFEKDFSFLIKYTTKLQLAAHRSSSVNIKLCKNTVFIGANSTVDSKVLLNHCIIDKNLKVTQSLENTLVLNKGE
ncbi:hypothetical protein K2X05_14830 [bacterium]|nr:hypothetical protein [bacterium]